MAADRVGKPQKIKTKNCMFPECGVEFQGRGKAKYCEEHRLPKYRKDLYKRDDNDGAGIVKIEHSECYAKRTTRTCGLDGCETEYEIVLIPRLAEYSNFCVDHRNEFRRKRFIKDHEDDSQDN